MSNKRGEKKNYKKVQGPFYKHPRKKKGGELSSDLRREEALTLLI